MVKILVVSQNFHPEQFRINDICFELVKKGHKVTVLTGLPNYPQGEIYSGYRFFSKRKEFIQGVEIVRSFVFGRGRNLIRLAANYLSFAFFASIKVSFLDNDFDVVYVYQISPITMVIPAFVYKVKNKKPLVIHCLDQWPISVTTGPISENSLIYKVLFKLSHFCYSCADLITISSKSFKAYFNEILKIDSTDKGLIYWPSYAEDIYQDVGKLDNGVFDLVYAGNIGPALSVETIVNAAALIDPKLPIHFHIVGDGLSRKSCEELAQNNNLSNMTFHGFHAVSEMKRFYALADAFLITMVNNPIVNNTLPAKLQSYMLSKKPIIGAISGEVKNVIAESDCGLACESLDAKGLSEAIMKAYQMPEHWDIWGKNAYAYYLKHFEKELSISNLEKILYNIVERGT